MNCLYCGVETTNPKFCTKSCAAKHNNQYHPKRLVEGNCLQCSKAIRASRKFCSPECRKDWNAANPVTRQPRSNVLGVIAPPISSPGWRKYMNYYITKHKRNTKAKAVEYLGGCCSICGYSKCLSALEFHHQDPSAKDFSIAMSSRKFEKIKAELDKCILVCANCHREIHELATIGWSPGSDLN